jgi:hypothetical protein
MQQARPHPISVCRPNAVCLLQALHPCTYPPPCQDATISTLATDVAAKLQALHGLQGKLREVQDYLAAVVAGKLPLNHDINGYLQVRMLRLVGRVQFLSERPSFSPAHMAMGW